MIREENNSVCNECQNNQSAFSDLYYIVCSSAVKNLTGSWMKGFLEHLSLDNVLLRSCQDLWARSLKILKDLGLFGNPGEKFGDPHTDPKDSQPWAQLS